MPPALASVLCYGFVGWLLYREIKHCRELSAALWLPSIWLFLSLSRSLVYWVSGGTPTDGGDYLEGSALDRNVRFGLMLWGLYVLHQRPARVSAVLAVNGLLLAIFAWMALSILWSDYSFVSLKRWIRATGFVIMALIVLTEDKPVVALEAVVRRVVYVAVPISVLLIKYYPALGITFHRWQGYPMWIGIGISKNDLGVLCAYGGIFLVRALAAVRPLKAIFRDREAQIHLLLLLLCFYMLRGSGSAKSATSTLVFLVGVTMMAAFALWRSRPQTVAQWALVTAILTAPFVLFGGPELVKGLVSSIGRDTTLTGRTEIWRALFEVAAQSPILGTGFGAFYLGDLTFDWSEISDGAIGEGHNGYLDVFLELGLIGLCLQVLFILFACSRILSTFAYNSPYAQLRTLLLVMVLMHNNTESGIFAGIPSLWFFYLVAGMNHPGSFATPADESAFSSTETLRDQERSSPSSPLEVR